MDPKSIEKGGGKIMKERCQKSCVKVMRAAASPCKTMQEEPVCPLQKPVPETRNQQPVPGTVKNISITPPVPGGTVADICVYCILYINI